jgi:tRNA (guanine37-N1)-methyltransferase
MKIDAITIFPEYFSPLRLSLIGKAQERGIVDVGIHDLRDFTTDNHHSVDDTPYGGGAGMIR